MYELGTRDRRAQLASTVENNSQVRDLMLFSTAAAATALRQRMQRLTIRRNILPAILVDPV
jgi:hypothetical protein